MKNSITTSYSYNHAGRLSNVTVGGVQKGGYIYNAVGQLVSRTVSNTTPSGTVHYVHDLNGNVIAETDGSGSTVREYVWIEHRGSGNGQATGAATPLAVVADVDTATPETYFVHPDHLDRPAMMTDASAGIVWNTTFLPFGSVHQITGTAANDNRFPGQWYQLESGLHYNWHRHYDPDLGRYTQPDPLGLVDGPIRYNYVNNDPLQAVDPRGEMRWFNWAAGALHYGKKLTNTFVKTPILKGQIPNIPYLARGVSAKFAIKSGLSGLFINQFERLVARNPFII